MINDERIRFFSFDIFLSRWQIAKFLIGKYGWKVSNVYQINQSTFHNRFQIRVANRFSIVCPWTNCSLIVHQNRRGQISIFSMKNKKKFVHRWKKVAFGNGNVLEFIVVNGWTQEHRFININKTKRKTMTTTIFSLKNVLTNSTRIIDRTAFIFLWVKSMRNFMECFVKRIRVGHFDWSIRVNIRILFEISAWIDLQQFFYCRTKSVKHRDTTKKTKTKFLSEWKPICSWTKENYSWKFLYVTSQERSSKNRTRIFFQIVFFWKFLNKLGHVHWSQFHWIRLKFNKKTSIIWSSSPPTRFIPQWLTREK